MNVPGAKKVRVFELPIVLTPAQQMIDDHPARFKVVKCGRRFGKSKKAKYWICKQAAKPGTINWYVAPTYQMVKEIAWREILDFLPQSVIKSTNTSELTIELKNKSLIQLKGSDNENALRGRRLDSLVMEEASFQKGHIWPEILRAPLADSRGPALFISTPKGINWFEKLYQYARTGKDHEWAGFHFTIYDNPYIAKSEIEAIKATTNEIAWRQEYMAEVMANTGLVYPELSDANFFDPAEFFEGITKMPCVRGIDWGSDADTGVVWQHVSSRGENVTMAEHVQAGWDVPRHSDVIKRMSWGRNIAPGNTVLDASAFRDEYNDGRSIAILFQREGITCVKASRDPGFSVDVAKRYLRGADGQPWAYIAWTCPKLREALGNWEHGQHEPDIAAAWRYALTHAHVRGLTYAHGGQVPTVEEVVASAGVPISMIAANRRLREQYEPQAGGWDFDDGVPLE